VKKEERELEGRRKRKRGRKEARREAGSKYIGRESRIEMGRESES
jgi:hypothetical protein